MATQTFQFVNIKMHICNLASLVPLALVTVNLLTFSVFHDKQTEVRTLKNKKEKYGCNIFKPLADFDMGLSTSNHQLIFKASLINLHHFIIVSYHLQLFSESFCAQI